MEENYFDIDKILTYAMEHPGELAPNDEFEWKRLCMALHTLKYDSLIFEAISRQDDKTRRDAGAAWRAHSRDYYRHFPDNDSAVAAIVRMAKDAWGESFVKDNFKSDKTIYMPDNFKTPNPRRKAAKPAPAPKPRPTPMYVDPQVVADLEAYAVNSNLFRFLCSVFDREKVAAAFKRYRVGAMPPNYNGSKPPRKDAFQGMRTTFPLINYDGFIHDIKIVPYGDDGHFLRSDPAPTTYYNAMFRPQLTAENGKQGECLFGEHLIRDARGAIGIVESEKTAMVASIVLPEFVWVATLGKSKLTPDRLAPLKGKKLQLLPDLDGVDFWRDKAGEYKRQGFDFFVCGDYITKHATPGSTEDVADILIREAIKEKEMNDGE